MKKICFILLFLSTVVHATNTDQFRCDGTLIIKEGITMASGSTYVKPKKEERVYTVTCQQGTVFDVKNYLLKFYLIDGNKNGIEYIEYKDFQEKGFFNLSTKPSPFPHNNPNETKINIHLMVNENKKIIYENTVPTKDRLQGRIQLPFLSLVIPAEKKIGVNTISGFIEIFPNFRTSGKSTKPLSQLMAFLNKTPTQTPIAQTTTTSTSISQKKRKISQDDEETLPPKNTHNLIGRIDDFINTGGMGMISINPIACEWNGQNATPLTMTVTGCFPEGAQIYFGDIAPQQNKPNGWEITCTIPNPDQLTAGASHFPLWKNYIQGLIALPQKEREGRFFLIPITIKTQTQMAGPVWFTYYPPGNLYKPQSSSKDLDLASVPASQGGTQAHPMEIDD